MNPRISRHTRALLFVTPLLWNCTPRTFPLGEVPIVGGSRDQREAVRDALLAFDAAVGPGRVQLSEVVFDSEGAADAAGRYSTKRSRIALAPDLGPLIPDVVRHELCHAIDHQEMLAPAIGGALDRLIPALAEEGAFAATGEFEGYPTPEDQRKETFADMCNRGPEVAALLAEACPDDPYEVSPVFAWMSDQVWSGDTWFPPSAAALGAEVSWQAVAPVDVLHVSAGYLGGSPFFNLWLGFASLVDPYTGEVVEYDPDLEVGEETNDLDVHAVVPFDGGTVSSQEGWSDGPASALAEATLPHLGTYQRIVYRPAPGPWERVADLCPDEVMDLVALDERVWYVWADDDLVSWTALTPSD
jgi:hypothetical protein